MILTLLKAVCFKGDYYIVIAVGNTSDETNRDILKAAGTKAVKNLELLTNK